MQSGKQGTGALAVIGDLPADAMELASLTGDATVAKPVGETVADDAARCTGDGSQYCGGTMRQWWLVIVLALVSLLAILDKNLMPLMAGSIKRDMGLSDVQISLLLGAAFAIANIGASLPAGWLADRVERRGLIAVGILLWSAMTAASGMASAYVALFAARVGLGFGEGLVPPACYSLIRDGVAERRRGRALAVYTMATTGGAGAALIVCGLLIGLIVSQGIDTLPIVGPVKPWQLALILIGFMGVPIALTLLTIPPVARASSSADRSATSFSDAFRLISRRADTLVPLLVYSLMHSMIMAATSAWFPALIERKFNLTPQQMGPAIGLLILICGPLGLSFVGISIDKLRERDRPAAAIVAIVGASVLALAGTVVPQTSGLWSFFAVSVFFVSTTTPFLVVTSMIVSQETPSNMTGKVMAIYLFFQALIGQTLAPTIVALLSDYAFNGTDNALGNAMSTLTAGCGAVGLAMTVILYRSMVRPKA